MRWWRAPARAPRRGGGGASNRVIARSRGRGLDPLQHEDEAPRRLVLEGHARVEVAERGREPELRHVGEDRAPALEIRDEPAILLAEARRLDARALLAGGAHDLERDG